MAEKITLEDAEMWIENVGLSDRYKIVRWADKASLKSTFLDVDRNIEFECEFSIFKRNLKRNPNTSFCITKEEQREKSRRTNIEKYGVDHFAKTQEFKDKTKETSLLKYGVENVMKSSEFFDKQRDSLLRSHGVTSPLKNPEIKERQKQTTKNRFGVESVLSLPHVRSLATKNSQSTTAINKKLKTMNERYGCDYPAQNQQIKNKIERTNEERYGAKWKFQLPDFQDKIFEEKIESGKIKIYKNKTISQHALEKNVSYSWILQQSKEIGLEEALNQDPHKTNLENIISNILQKNLGSTFYFNKKLENTKFKPDFLIENKKLIIECDGIFWHTDRVIKDWKYHLNKKNKYKECGYSSLFFRSDEIVGKAKIVESIINNKLGINRRVYARKCSIDEVRCDSFFDENHLMGLGSGRIYCLKYNDEIVAAIQVKWRKSKILEISRFCTKNNTSVVGGFDKLVKDIIKKEHPEKIITFIDERYGSGAYLEKLGWKYCNSYVSFKWADEKSTYHRMQHPGNSGYEKGFYKIWDCGQARWELNL